MPLELSYVGLSNYVGEYGVRSEVMLCHICSQPQKSDPCKSSFCCAVREARYRLKSNFQSDYQELFPLLCPRCAAGVPLVHYRTSEGKDFWMHREASTSRKERHSSCEGNHLRTALENVKSSSSTSRTENRQAVS